MISMSDQTEMLEEIRRIKNLCIINFFELQDLKRRLKVEDVAAIKKEAHYAYLNAMAEWINELDMKTHGLVKDYPHLLAEK